MLTYAASRALVCEQLLVFVGVTPAVQVASYFLLAVVLMTVPHLSVAGSSSPAAGLVLVRADLIAAVSKNGMQHTTQHAPHPSADVDLFQSTATSAEACRTCPIAHGLNRIAVELASSSCPTTHGGP